MAFSEYVFLISTGIAAGFINTVAGGGSLLTLPLLIFMGLPAAEANASNRVAIIIQNIFAVKGFKSKGVAVFPFAYWVSISATLGALLGAYLATEISNTSFNKILSIVMVFVLVITVLKPYLDKKEALERFTKKRNLISLLLFFGIGIYGGFIQAGVTSRFTPSASILASTLDKGISILLKSASLFVSFNLGSKNFFQLKRNICIFRPIINKLFRLDVAHTKLIFAFFSNKRFYRDCFIMKVVLCQNIHSMLHVWLK